MIVDVSCVTEQGLRLYEVLGADRCSYQDLRDGATRLLEIDHTLPNSATGLYLVLCGPTTEDWAADTIREAGTALGG
ncbi:hypothetical protein ACWERV_15515 [Streptomyces sp. NPDC004031]